MFRKKTPSPPSRLDYSDKILYCLITLLIVTTLGFAFSISILNAINAYFRYEETKPNAPIPELPITDYYPHP